MNISWKWLKQLVDLHGINIEYLVDRLTLAGFEVENIRKLPENNTILEISSTTNRADTLSVMGIAKEVSAIIDKPINNIYNQQTIRTYNRIFNNKTSQNQAILQTKIINIRIADSPKWLKSLLNYQEIKIENSIMDIISFIDLKWAKKFTIKQITNYQTHQSEKQIDLFLYFYLPNHNSKYIRDETHKADLLTAYSECMLLIAKIYNGTIGRTDYFSSITKLQRPTSLRITTLKNTLGPLLHAQKFSKSYDILIDQSLEILKRLNFIVIKSKKIMIITIPLNRLDDVYREIDIIEEIGRIYGFDKFLDILPQHTLDGTKTKEQYRLGHIRSILRSSSFHESIHSPLEEKIENQVAIYNPLIDEFSSLKKSLVHNLIKVNIYNTRQGNQPVNIFEVGRVFTKNHSYNEFINIAGIFSRQVENRRTWVDTQEDFSWFQAKGQMEEIFERLKLDINWSRTSYHPNFNSNSKNLFNSRESAILTIDSRPIGIFGSIKKNLFATKGIINQLYGFEILINQLGEQSCSTKLFTPYSKYPSIIRDITATFNSNIAVQEIIETILDGSHLLVESVKLFSVYENEKNEKKNRNLSFRIIYRSPTATLTNSIVEDLELQIKIRLTAKFKINL